MGTGTVMDMGTDITRRSNKAESRDAREKLAFLFRQLFITGLNALIGFLIVRQLGKPDYAIYTIAFSLLSLFVNITNMGITPAMSGIGGRVWNNRFELQALLNTALRLRGQLGWWFALPFVAYCIWQFRQTEIQYLPLAALIALLLTAAWVQLQTALYAIVLQLNNAVRRLQLNELGVALLKLAGISVLLWAKATSILLIAWVCACLWLNLWLNRRRTADYLEPHAGTNPGFQKEINSIIRSNFVRTIYWSLEGQIAILLCAIFSTTESIADIGALGRLSIYFSIFQAFILNYSLPGIAKSRTVADIRVRTQRILLLTLAIIAPVILWSVVHPASLLWILGPNYATLEGNLFFYLLAVATGQIAAVMYQICAARAWIQMNRYYAPLALPLQIALVWWLHLSELNQVILFLGINNCFFLLFNVLMYLHSARRYQPRPTPA